MPESQSTVSWLGQSSSVMDLIGRFINIKEHKREQAVNQLGGMMQMAQAGFVPDEKAFAKYMKQAGLNLPVPKTIEDMKALYGAMKSEKEGTAFGQEGKKGGGGQPQQQGQPQAQGMPEGMPQNKYTEGLMAAQQKLQSGKPLSQEEQSQMYLNGIASRAVQLMNTKAATDQQKAENERTVQDLHGKALQGDKQAIGTLIKHGEMPFNFQYEQWSRMNEQQRGDMLDVAAGHESEAQRVERSSNIAQSLINDGRVKDVKDAFKIADILAKGGEIPPDLQSKMKSRSFTDMANQVKLGATLQEMGVPSNKLAGVLRAAEAGGLENALPGNIGKSFNERRLDLEASRQELEKLRYEKELEIAAKMEAAERRKGITDAQKAQLEEFKSYYEIARAMYGKEGKNLPEDLRKGMIERTAKALDLETEEVNTFWHFLTGGTEIKVKKPKPTITPDSQSMIDNLSGGGEKKPDQTPQDKGISDFMKGRRRKRESGGPI